MNFESILQIAIEDLKVKENIYSLANENFEEVAYFEMKAAQARVNGILKEVKQNERNNLQE